MPHDESSELGDRSSRVEKGVPALPRGCSFASSDWLALAPFWYPVAFSHEVKEKPFAARLLDERLVIFRVPDGTAVIARDLCLHRGAPLSMGSVQGGELVCGYHGFRYDKSGACVRIPAHPGAAIPPKLKLQTFPARERYGLIWTRLVDNGESPFPDFEEWNDPNYLQVLPDSVELDASAGRQMEGFLDVSHFAFVHVTTFGEVQNPEVPTYPVELTPAGFRADYVSTVSNYPVTLKHLNPSGFKWRRLFETWLPFTAKLTVFFPNDGRLHILNVASPVSARKTRVFVPICRNFDRDAPLQATLDFNHQVFAEDKAIVEQQYPEDLPINLQEEVHIRADKSSITYRQGLARLGLGRAFTA
jgi:vanillate O-demethylase monooxygenase subunit